MTGGTIIFLLEQHYHPNSLRVFWGNMEVSAKGMDPKHLKETYGKHLTFWGGGIDTQKTLPFGKPEQVREEVLRHCDIFAKDGGFVFNTVHNIQADVPVANLVAMIDALHEFNK